MTTAISIIVRFGLGKSAVLVIENPCWVPCNVGDVIGKEDLPDMLLEFEAVTAKGNAHAWGAIPLNSTTWTKP